MNAVLDALSVTPGDLGMLGILLLVFAVGILAANLGTDPIPDEEGDK